jgi:hypothetical protein
MTEEEKLELEYLRYFYHAVQPSLGPADWDIMVMITKDYVRSGRTLPVEYKLEADDEE